jgi:hypothetical protein
MKLIVKNTLTNEYQLIDKAHYGDHYLNTAADIMGISETELRDDIRENRQNYHITVIDVNRKKDL